MKKIRFKKNDTVFFIFQNNEKGNKYEICSGKIIDSKHIWENITHEIQTDDGQILSLLDDRLFSFRPDEITDIQNTMLYEKLLIDIALMQTIKKRIENDMKNASDILKSDLIFNTYVYGQFEQIIIQNKISEYEKLHFSFSEILPDKAIQLTKDRINNFLKKNEIILNKLENSIKEAEHNLSFYTETKEPHLLL